MSNTISLAAIEFIKIKYLILRVFLQTREEGKGIN